jgi:1-deoxy-D-xylulose-5-phosphate reductoisomerase
MHGAQFGILDLVNKNLSFGAVDPQKYRMLTLAIEAAKSGGAYPVVYNAANEAALELFLNEEIRFVDIPVLVEESLGFSWTHHPETVQQILGIDEEAKAKTRNLAEKRKRAVK